MAGERMLEEFTVVLTITPDRAPADEFEAARANAEITDMILEGYQERHALNDRIFGAVSQTIHAMSEQVWEPITVERQP